MLKIHYINNSSELCKIGKKMTQISLLKEQM